PGALGGLAPEAAVPPASSGGHGASGKLTYLPSVRAAFTYSCQCRFGFHERSAAAPRTRTFSALARYPRSTPTALLVTVVWKSFTSVQKPATFSVTLRSRNRVFRPTS